MAKATHNGTCQVCGNQQAVSVKTGTLAKHGYTVDFGYFQGVCPGAGNLPLEQSLTQYDRMVADLTHRAETLEAKTIVDIKLVHIKTRRDGKKVTVACENDEQVKAVESWNSFERLAKTALWELHREAKLIRSHLNLMDDVREARHGKPLIEREQKPVEKKDKFWANTRREAWAKKAELESTGKYSKVTVRQSRYGDITITATLAA